MPPARFPSVSIIICTYRREQSLCDAVESVLSQDYEGKKELIVIDQTEKHTAGVEEFLRSHGEHLRRVRQSVPNLPMARNAGARLAGGELIFFADDDVVLPPNALRALAGHFRPGELKGLAGLVISEDTGASSLRGYPRPGAGRTGAGPQLVKVNSFIGAVMLVPAKAVRMVGGFDERLGKLTPTASGEDLDFCRRLRRAGIPLFVDSGIQIPHRAHLGGGCCVRSIPSEDSKRYQLKSLAYLHVKEQGRLGASGWLALARGFVANRREIRQGPRHVWNNFKAVCAAVAEVKAFLSTAGGASFPTLRRPDKAQQPEGDETCNQ